VKVKEGACKATCKRESKIPWREAVSMIKWIQTRRLSIENPLSLKRDPSLSEGEANQARDADESLTTSN
jgi:hypothetical protein